MIENKTPYKYYKNSTLTNNENLAAVIKLLMKITTECDFYIFLKILSIMKLLNHP